MRKIGPSEMSDESDEDDGQRCEAEKESAL